MVTLTSVGGEVVAPLGDFTKPFTAGKLNIIGENADANILLIDGNPLEAFSVVGTGYQWFGAEPRPDSPETI